MIPVVNTKIENIKRFRKSAKYIKLRNAKQSIKIVAKFGVIPILLKPLESTVIKGLKIYRNRYREGITRLYFTLFIILI